MEYFVHILMGTIWVLVGLFVERYPETLAGYNTMSAERRKKVDIRATGRFLSRTLFLCSVISFVGIATIALRWQEVSRVILLLPIPIVLVGAVVGSLRYDETYRRKRHGSTDKNRTHP